MWIRQVMRVESGGHEYSDGQLIVSSAGAMGLMQLEPETYSEMASRYGLGSDPFNPSDNIMAGAAYIHEMYQVYGSPGFLAAYNAGPGRLDAYENDHTPLPYETVNYVAMIAPNIQGYYPQNRSEADQLALNTLPAGEDGGILPPGFTPEAPGPVAPDDNAAPVQPAPVQVASIAPDNSAIYSAPQTASVQPAAAASDTADDTQSAISATPVAAPADASGDSSQTAYASTPAATETSDNIQPAISAVPVAAPAEASRDSSQTAYTATPATVPEPPPPPPSLGVIPAAMADLPPPPPPPSLHPGTGHYGWAIQVGAYDNSSNARAALGIAELSAIRVLSNGRPVIVSVHADGHVKYRARVTGLAQEDAVDACNRLSGGPTGCVVLSPDAQR
jgi:hypothetical protein